METMNEVMNEFRAQLKKGNVQKAYQYIFAIFSGLTKTIKNGNTAYSVGAIYHGYLDMTYIPIVSAILKKHGLKIAVVFDYTEFMFEIWLSSHNKTIQKEIWQLIQAKNWTKYRVLETLEKEDSIIEYSINEIQDYSNINDIVDLLYKKVCVFTNDVETFIQKNM